MPSASRDYADAARVDSRSDSLRLPVVALILIAVVTFLVFFAVGRAVSGDEAPHTPGAVPVVVRQDPERNQDPVPLGRGPTELTLPSAQPAPLPATTPAAPSVPQAAPTPEPEPPADAPEPAPREQPSEPPAPPTRTFEDVR